MALAESDVTGFQDAGAMLGGLRALFPADTYALLANVPSRTGAGSMRRADAIVQSLWPSRGLWLAGVEIKVSRGDWLRELKDPAKADEVARFCDHWYLAVADVALVRDGELPAMWGLIAPRQGALAIVRAAPALEPVPMTPLFRAALLRSAQNQGAAERQRLEARRDARAEGFEEGKRLSTWEGQQAQKKLAELRAHVGEIEAAAGAITSWSARRIGEAMALYRALSGNTRLDDSVTHARNCLHAADQQLAVLEASVKRLATPEEVTATEGESP